MARSQAFVRSSPLFPFNWAVRWGSAAALAALLLPLSGKGQEGKKPTPDVAALIERLDDKDDRVRWDALATLQRMVGPKDLPLVLRAARDKRVNVREASFQLFFRYTKYPKQVVPVLLEGLRDKDVRIRRSACMGASGYGTHSREVIATLIKLLDDKDVPKTKGHSSVAERAASSLWGIGPNYRRAYPALIAKMKKGPDRLRVAAGMTLASVARRDRAFLAVFLPILLETLKESKEADLRAEAAGFLGQVGPQAKSAVPALLQALRARPVPDPKKQERLLVCIIYALGEIGPASKASVPDLVKIVGDEKRSRNLRHLSMQALEQMGPAAKAAIPALTKLRDRPQITVDDGVLHDAAVRALKKIEEKP
jgi:HEAT repeat protein